MQATSRVSAQRRANDIRVFRDELTRLEQDGVVDLPSAQRDAIQTYHDTLLSQLTTAFDIDRDEHARHLSLGMRTASFLGALAFAASVYFLFYQFWGYAPEPIQVTVLIAAPTLALIGTHWVRKRDTTGYFTKLAAMVCFACFVLNIAMLGQIFNLAPSDNALLPLAALALLLAYGCDLRLLLVAALACIAAYVAARVGTIGGMYWLHFGERPENFFPLALILFMFPRFVAHPHREDFPAVYRIFGLLSLLLPILVLAHFGRASYLPWERWVIEAFYQVAGFILSGAAIWLGLRCRWPDTVNTGITFFVLFLYTKFFDWWWHVLPKSLFFLLLGLLAVLILLVIKRLRAASREIETPKVAP